MPDRKRNLSLNGCMDLLQGLRLLVLDESEADMLPTRSLLLAASSESGSIFFVLLSLLTEPLLPLPFCALAPFELLPRWTLPFSAELEFPCPDT